MASFRQHSLDIDENDHARNILQRLDSMRKEKKNCDLIIRVEEKEFHANKDVMCAGSDYFDAMFSHDTKEKQEGVVEMKEVKLFAVEKCIDFIYSGKIEVSEDEYDGLLYCASLMQLTVIGDKICSLLEAHLTTKSFFNTREIAMKFSRETLNAICDKFAIDCLFQLANEEEFNKLDETYLSFLISSKKSSDPRGEDCKLAIALRWIKADQDNRERYFTKIVQLLDTTKLTPGYARYMVEREELCIKFPEFMRQLVIQNTIFHRVEISGPPNMLEYSMPIKSPSSNSLIIFDESLKLVQLYRPSDNIQTQVTAYHDEMGVNFTACMMEEYLYIFNMEAKALRLCIRKEESTWDQIADMLHCHGVGLQCTILENSIYVGGDDKMERYKTQDEKWENINLKGNVCNESALINFESCVLVIGGWCGKAVSNVSTFSPPTSKWMSLPSTNVARYSPSANVFNGKLYVAGGFCGEDLPLRHFEMYDGLSQLWTILPKMCSARSYFKLCVVDDQVCVIGNKSDEFSMEVYDAELRTWTLKENCPKMKIWAHATEAAYIPIK